jgi:protein-tyrosine phosphatase
VTVLFVCTGNWHRSPIAEHLLRARLDDLRVRDITVRSAGTIARAGYALPVETLSVLAERGIDAGGFVTTRLDEAALADVDVLIGAGRPHRAAAVTLRAALLNRAFTLYELARICATIDPAELTATTPAERLLELVQLAASHRVRTMPADPSLDDLDDPIGKPYAEFVRCVDAVDGALDAVVPLLTAAGELG